MCMRMRGHVQQSAQCEFGNEFHTAARGFQESEAASAGTCARISVFLHHFCLHQLALPIADTKKQNTERRKRAHLEVVGGGAKCRPVKVFALRCFLTQRHG
jgi:hypothetical protein